MSNSSTTNKTLERWQTHTKHLSDVRHTNTQIKTHKKVSYPNFSDAPGQSKDMMLGGVRSAGKSRLWSQISFCQIKVDNIFARLWGLRGNKSCFWFYAACNSRMLHKGFFFLMRSRARIYMYLDEWEITKKKRGRGRKKEAQCFHYARCYCPRTSFPLPCRCLITWAQSQCRKREAMSANKVEVTVSPNQRWF